VSPEPTAPAYRASHLTTATRALSLMNVAKVLIGCHHRPRRPRAHMNSWKSLTALTTVFVRKHWTGADRRRDFMATKSLPMPSRGDGRRPDASRTIYEAARAIQQIGNARELVLHANHRGAAIRVRWRRIGRTSAERHRRGFVRFWQFCHFLTNLTHCLLCHILRPGKPPAPAQSRRP
jgi:hypothetical protein